MRDLSLFGTEAYPLHPSALKAIVECPWRAVMPYLFGSDDDHGVAGDTGSAMHRAAAEFHRHGNVAAALVAMQEGIASYPLADLQDAAALFLSYASDARNSCKTLLIEAQVRFEIAPAPEDPTGAPIVIEGRLDQVRVVDGVPILVDIKTTKKDPIEMLGEYSLQQAAYLVGANFVLKTPVDRACILYPRLYRSDPGRSNVMYHYPWRLKDTADILACLRHTVARIRSGDVWHVPNSNCKWCPARSPDLCLPKLQEVSLRGTP